MIPLSSRLRNDNQVQEYQQRHSAENTPHGMHLAQSASNRSASTDRLSSVWKISWCRNRVSVDAFRSVI